MKYLLLILIMSLPAFATDTSGDWACNCSVDGNGLGSCSPVNTTGGSDCTLVRYATEPAFRAACAACESLTGGAQTACWAAAAAKARPGGVLTASCTAISGSIGSWACGCAGSTCPGYAGNEPSCEINY